MSGRKFKDRVKGLAWLPAKRIDDADKNFRTHGDKQGAALLGILADIGIAGVEMVWVPDDEARASLSAIQTGDLAAFAAWLAGFRGQFKLYDGHLRKKKINAQPIPTIVTDLDPREAAEALATFDPVGALAGFDVNTFADLLNDFSSTEAAVQEMCADLLMSDKAMAAQMEADTGGEDDESDSEDEPHDNCPQCGQRMP